MPRIKKQRCILKSGLLAQAPRSVRPLQPERIPRLRRHAPRLLILPVLLAVAGCAPSVHLPRPEPRLPAAFETPSDSGGAYGPDSAVAPQPALALDRWWDGFADPQMSRLIETALSRSTTIRLAWERLAEARAQRNQIRAGTYPAGNLSLSASKGGTGTVWGTVPGGGGSSVGDTQYSLSSYPSWDIDLFGRLAALRKKADLDRAASTMDYQATRLALAADVASALIQARYLAVQLEDARGNQRIARELADSGELGRSRGLTSAQDAARLSADAESNDAEVERLAAELRAAKRLLLIQIGEPDASTDSLAIEPLLPSAPALPPATPALLLTRRPDLRSAELAVRSAARQVKADRMALFPDFTIQPGSQGTEILASGGVATGIWSVAAGLALPVLDRTRLMATLRISEARGRQAVIKYESTVQTAFGETENALTRIAAGRRRVEQLTRAARDADAAFAAAREGNRVGVTDLTTLLQAERVAIQDRAARDGARAALLGDTITAIRALGGGWTPGDAPPSPPQTLSANTSSKASDNR